MMEKKGLTTEQKAGLATGDMPEAKVAIISRTKDRPIMLPRLLDSIQRQNFKDFIWVLINDAGVKEPVDAIAESAKNSGINILVVHREVSYGMESASNHAIRCCKSKYIVIHDDDDSWENDFLSETVAFLEATTLYIGVVTQSTAIFEDISGDTILIKRKAIFNDSLRVIQGIHLFHGNAYPPISFLFRRDVWEELGGFDESLPVLGDWDFNVRYLLKGDIGVIQKTLANYHFRSEEDKSIYGNSVTAASTKHEQYNAILRNRWLRSNNEQLRLVGLCSASAEYVNSLKYELRNFIRLLEIVRKIAKKLRLHKLLRW